MKNFMQMLSKGGELPSSVVVGWKEIFSRALKITPNKPIDTCDQVGHPRSTKRGKYLEEKKSL